MPVIARRRQLYAGLCLAVIAIASCHGDGFSYTNPVNHEPLDPTPPVQIARDLLEDQYAAWLPDGSGLAYSFIPQGDISQDRCLGVMAPGGGQIHAFRCYRNDMRNDSTDVLAVAAPWTGGIFAWMEQHNLRGRTVPDHGAIVVGTLNDLETPVRLTQLPYTAPSGNTHVTITDLRWLSAQRLAYIGADMIVRAPCMRCDPDTVVIAKEVMLLDRSGGGPVPLPDTDEVTSIWPTADSTGLYFTRAGDTRVWRRELAGGAPDMIHDFGPAGIVRDVSVVGNQLAAVVGGKVSYGTEVPMGARQIDSGGTVMTVNLSTGATREHWIVHHYFRRPVLSPDGAGLLVEAVDSGSSNPDLWLFRVE